MHRVKIRFEDRAYEFVALQATRSGMSFAEFVRGAALVRAALVFAELKPTDSAEMLSLYEKAAVVLDQLPAKPT